MRLLLFPSAHFSVSSSSTTTSRLSWFILVASHSAGATELLVRRSGGYWGHIHLLVRRWTSAPHRRSSAPHVLLLVPWRFSETTLPVSSCPSPDGTARPITLPSRRPLIVFVRIARWRTVSALVVASGTGQHFTASRSPVTRQMHSRLVAVQALLPAPRLLPLPFPGHTLSFPLSLLATQQCLFPLLVPGNLPLLAILFPSLSVPVHTPVGGCISGTVATLCLQWSEATFLVSHSSPGQVTRGTGTTPRVMLQTTAAAAADVLVTIHTVSARRLFRMEQFLRSVMVSLLKVVRGMGTGPVTGRGGRCTAPTGRGRGRRWRRRFDDT